MTAKKNVLLTFDYELFLGERSGTVDKCIIEPTESVLDILKENGIEKGIFFVDTTYMYRLSEMKNPQCQSDLQQITRQLIRIITDGHYVFPHIHPHWLDATYNQQNGQWTLIDLSKYRFHHISADTRDFLFEYAIGFITQLQAQAGIKYNIDGYRAGGWCIQPFDDFIPYFEKYGILYDFSVLSGFHLLDEQVYYDFRQYPDNEIFRFDGRGRVDPDGKYAELAITRVRIPAFVGFLNKVQLKVLHKMGIRNMGDGLAVKKYWKIRDADANRGMIEMTSIELLSSLKLNLYLEFISNNEYIHFMSHPKMLSRHNIQCFDKFIKRITRDYVVNTDHQLMALKIPVNKGD